MTQNVITYYIPQNLNITKGQIYNLYINKIKNLDLSNIITPKEEQITITKTDLKNILDLSNNTEKLYNQSLEIVKKITKERK